MKKLSKKKEKMEKEKDKVELKKLDYECKESILISRNNYSKTDPDAGVMKMKDGLFKPGL